MLSYFKKINLRNSAIKTNVIRTNVKTLSLIAVASTATLFSSGCSQINRAGANIALGFVDKYIVPPIITMDDTDMACASSNAMSPMVVATKAMGANPAKLGVLMYSGAGLCAEDKALEEELRFMRSSKAGLVEEAQDARIAQKRWAGVAAKRQYAAYKIFAERWEQKYKIRLGEDCPRMKTDSDKTTYLLGFVAGLQAVVNDTASGNVVNVPKDIAAKVERGMKCIDNEQFWGAPNAIRAAIWTLLPGASDGKPDPYLVMKQSAKLGESKGVRLAHAIYAMAASTSGEDTKIRDAIKTFGATEGNMTINPEFKLFDQMGAVIVRNISDRYWTENTGKRTPLDDGMSVFWDESSAGEEDMDINLDDVL